MSRIQFRPAMSSLLGRLCLLLIAGVALLSSASPAFADKVSLKDGTVLDGRIVREQDGYIWIKYKLGSLEQERMIAPGEIAGIERDGAAPAATAANEPTPAAPVADTSDITITTIPARPGTPKGVVLTLGDRENGDMVGVYLVANILERAIPTIEKEIGTDNTGVVVLRFTSGGGYGAEVQKVSDVIHNEYKKRWRTVGWIDSAISAAAMSAHCLEEIYFTTRGNYGACTGFYGSLDRPVEGYELEKSIYQMEKISARSGWNSLIMRAMQVQQPLSATVNEDGHVTWYGDTSTGKILVNRDLEILTFSAQSALEVKFSRGTADTLEELTKAMGYQEIEWVGKSVKGSVWPISKSEQMQLDFRRKVKTDENNTNRYYQNYGMHVQLAQNEQDRELRGALVNKARQALEQLKSMVRNNPAFARNNWGGRREYEEWVKDQEKLLRDLMR